MSIHHLPWDWTLWHIATRNLINKVNRRLEGRDITPPGFPKHDRLPGMIELQKLCAARVGDVETRARISPILAAQEVIAHKLAEQLLGAGPTADMMAPARQVRDRLMGPEVVQEMLDAMATEGLPFIVQS